MQEEIVIGFRLGDCQSLCHSLMLPVVLLLTSGHVTQHGPETTEPAVELLGRLELPASEWPNYHPGSRAYIGVECALKDALSRY